MKHRIFPSIPARRKDGNCLTLLLVLLLAAAALVWLARNPWRHFLSRELRREKAEALAIHDPTLAATRGKIAAAMARTDERLEELRKVERALDTAAGKARLAAAVRPLEQSRADLAAQLSAIDAKVEGWIVATRTERAGAWGLAEKEQPALLEAGRQAVANADLLNETYQQALRAAGAKAGSGPPPPSALPVEKPPAPIPALAHATLNQAEPRAVESPAPGDPAEIAATREAERVAGEFVQALAGPTALAMIRQMDGVVEPPGGIRMPSGDAAVAHLRAMHGQTDCRHEILSIEETGEPNGSDTRSFLVRYRRHATPPGGEPTVQDFLLRVDLTGTDPGRDGWKVRRWLAPD